MTEACDSETLAASCPVAMKSAASPLAGWALVLAAPARKAPAMRIWRAGTREVNTQGRYQAETGTVEITVGTTEDVAPGIFHDEDLGFTAALFTVHICKPQARILV